MKQITQNYRTGELKIEDVPFPVLKPGGILVRNHSSVISAGTERATLEVSRKGYVGKAKAKPELVKQVIEIAKKQGLKKTYDLVMNRLNTPIPLGYSTAGAVIEVGRNAPEFQVGDRVACAGAGYASHAEIVYVPRNLCVPLPPEVSFEDGSYTTLGAIALQGLRQADVRLGETVAVIGLGLIGLLTIQLLKASGCRVIALDIDSSAVDHGRIFGADLAVDLKDADVPLLVQTFTQKIGADAVLITASTTSNQPVELAGEMSRKKGRVVVVGDVGLAIPRSLYYQKELDFKISCSYGPGRYDPAYEEHGLDYPPGYVRWTERRNMTAFLEQVKEKKVDLQKMTTHRFKFEDAEQAYRLISAGSGGHFIGVLLEYDFGRSLSPVIRMTETKMPPKSQIRVGLVGAGNFAQANILPALSHRRDVTLVGVVAAEGYLARSAAKKFGIQTCYSDPQGLFEDPDINTIVIATRHDLHGPYVLQALKYNKNVYVEKPLALAEDELKGIIRAHKESKADVLVGFNRRFAPHLRKCREFFADRGSPLFINYRINAGPVPAEHWTQSQEEGGGRIIGEVCHFVDLCQFLCQSNFKSLYAQNLGQDRLRDNVSLVLKFGDGSVANICYLSNGDKTFPKERIEVFGQNSIAVIDDFRRIQLVRGGKVRLEKSHQDKGITYQIESWIQSLKSGQPIPIPFPESLNSTIATFMVHESLNKGIVVYFDDYSQRFFE